LPAEHSSCASARRACARDGIQRRLLAQQHQAWRRQSHLVGGEKATVRQTGGIGMKAATKMGIAEGGRRNAGGK